MNILGAHSMRIIALPLARVRISQDAKIKPYPAFNADTLLVFYHFDLISSCGGRGDLPWHKRVLKSVTNKTADLWTSLGKAPKGSWKLWTYDLGERIADRIDFEELALGNVYPSLASTVPLTGTSAEINDVKKNRRQTHSVPKIQLIYPPSLYPSHPTVAADHVLHPPLAHLQTLLDSRGPRHRRGFYLWMFIAPLTAPLILIPLVPNLPLFFCAWRSWSHYRAYRSSRYLSSLLDRGLIEPNPSLELDGLYASFASSPKVSRDLPPPCLGSRSSEKKPAFENVAADRKSAAATGTGAFQSRRVLLTREAILRIIELFQLPESATLNVYRAVEQARARLGDSS